MIGLNDIYKVVEAMAPLYAALAMGYGSVRWWHLFTPNHCEAISRFVAYFALPFFTFDFTLHIDPYTMNFRLILADTLSKVLIVVVSFAWARFSPKGNYGWSITSYSLSTLTNSLVVGVPLVNAMYGSAAKDLIVQISVVQAILWLSFLLFVLEFWKSSLDVSAGSGGVDGSSDHVISVESELAEVVDDREKVEVVEVNDSHISSSSGGGGGGGGDQVVESIEIRRISFWAMMKTVVKKLAVNPNFHASFLGIAWALVASRWNVKMPTIIEGCVLIMSKSGTGMAMFSMGLFMALQEKMISCGTTLTIYGIVLKFVAGPAAMAITSIVVGLHGEAFRIGIIQAALPQAIISFVFAHEYGLHADVLSTAVIFGTLASLPILVAYYIVLELV